ncbi:MAG: hypothetical protein SGILL_001453 [Bacillariaceae sp.]
MKRLATKWVNHCGARGNKCSLWVGVNAGQPDKDAFRSRGRIIPTIFNSAIAYNGSPLSDEEEEDAELPSEPSQRKRDHHGNVVAKANKASSEAYTYLSPKDCLSIPSLKAKVEALRPLIGMAVRYEYQKHVRFGPKPNKLKWFVESDIAAEEVAAARSKYKEIFNKEAEIENTGKLNLGYALPYAKRFCLKLVDHVLARISCADFAEKVKDLTVEQIVNQFMTALLSPMTKRACDPPAGSEETATHRARKKAFEQNATNIFIDQSWIVENLKELFKGGVELDDWPRQLDGKYRPDPPTETSRVGKLRYGYQINCPVREQFLLQWKQQAEPKYPDQVVEHLARVFKTPGQFLYIDESREDQKDKKTLATLQQESVANFGQDNETPDPKWHYIRLLRDIEIGLREYDEWWKKQQREDDDSDHHVSSDDSDSESDRGVPMNGESWMYPASFQKSRTVWIGAFSYNADDIPMSVNERHAFSYTNLRLKVASVAKNFKREDETADGKAAILELKNMLLGITGV